MVTSSVDLKAGSVRRSLKMKELGWWETGWGERTQASLAAGGGGNRAPGVRSSLGVRALEGSPPLLE